MEHPFVLTHHMSGAAFGQVGHFGGFKLRHRDIPQGLDSHAPGGFEALLAAFVVFAADEGVFHARVDNEQAEVRGQRDVFHRLGSAIEKDEVVLEPKNRRRLIEQAAIHANEFILGAAAEFRDIQARERKRIELHQQRGRGDLQRGRTRKPRTSRQGRIVANGKPSRFGTGAGEHFRDTQRVIGPLSGALQSLGAVEFFNVPYITAGQLHEPVGQFFTGGRNA